MVKLDKRILDSQIEVFLEWSRRYGTYAGFEREWLDEFAIHTTKTDILDVDDKEVDLFIETIVKGRIKWNDYKIERIKSALEQMRRFYTARTRNGKSRPYRGRPPHIGVIARAQEYRKMGLTLRDIAFLMKRSIPLIHRWVNYPLKDEDIKP